MQRRERTRQLIALGGLIAKAGLVELVDDDRADSLRRAARARSHAAGRPARAGAGAVAAAR